ncbi:helix-turn-helix transcriptional regulator [Robertmurraya massiliosenegalensis]|uniref:helix-turn-helix transcriptional regulator n=1 Tax=Robertmurraya massiliosenegalensis TaxID=1287657 RepID=UPI0002DF4A3B|nr:helix-turn-helix transcriptional regulator [Robertmurraya massiliosenegalensis]
MKKNRGVPSEFADSMEHYRIKKGISQNKLADSIGVSSGYLSRIKNGKRLNPSVPIAMAIAKELDIPMEELMVMLGLNNELNDISELISVSEFTFRGQLVNPEAKEVILDILSSILPHIMRGDTE